ncbi:MAG: putative DNA binding domain-containing protein, partial [Chlamydiia bacterium]|nr:putative DNA binding domain-containing protein [Chlamydiia bacterium]
MIEHLIHQKESKTLEFKRDTSSMQKILQTIIAFANTSGGTIVIGVENENHHITGVVNALAEEERLSSAISDSIAPQILPRIEIHSYRKKELIAIQVSCNPAPYYLKKNGPKQGVYVRLGSTNRVADPATLMELERLKMHVSFDELPCLVKREKDIDWNHVRELFNHKKNKRVSSHKYKNLGLITTHMEKFYPSNAAVLVFGLNREDIFPDAIIRCAR